MKRLIVAALVALAAAVSLASPASAQQGAFITSIVYWTGPNCIPVRYSEGFTTDIGTICGKYSERSYFAVPGQYIGADPMPFDTTVTLGCSLLINGVPNNTDYAPSGDRHNVNCLRMLAFDAPLYPLYPVPPPPAPPIRVPLLRAQ